MYLKLEKFKSLKILNFQKFWHFFTYLQPHITSYNLIEFLPPWYPMIRKWNFNIWTFISSNYHPDSSSKYSFILHLKFSNPKIEIFQKTSAVQLQFFSRKSNPEISISNLATFRILEWTTYGVLVRSTLPQLHFQPKCPNRKFSRWRWHSKIFGIINAQNTVNRKKNPQQPTHNLIFYFNSS